MKKILAALCIAGAARACPDHARADRHGKNRKSDHLALAITQQYSRSPRSTIKRQAPGADLEHGAQQRHGRAPSDDLQRVMYVVNETDLRPRRWTASRFWRHPVEYERARRARREPWRHRPGAGDHYTASFSASRSTAMSSRST